jgi:hypothetical protein
MMDSDGSHAISMREMIVFLEKFIAKRDSKADS